MSSSKTITLTWSSQELEMLLHCMSRHYPRPPLMVSEASQTCYCPTCYTVLKENSEYCSSCGQRFDWEETFSLMDANK